MFKGFCYRHNDKIHSCRKENVVMNNLKISKVISFLLMVCLVGTFCISGISTAYAEENDDESVSSEVNSAKEQMEEEEGYIVNLVSQRMGNNLTSHRINFSTRS